MALIWIIITALCFIGFLGMLINAKEIKEENDKLYTSFEIQLSAISIYTPNEIRMFMYFLIPFAESKELRELVALRAVKMATKKCISLPEAGVLCALDHNEKIKQINNGEMLFMQ